MNQQNKFLRLFFIAAFLVLMFVSAWATVESLHRLLPEWPIAFFWAISLIFFTLASMGVKLIVDSFNQNKRINGRIWRLLGGVLMLLSFWIVFSLPTNTHTFFYKAIADQVLTNEIAYTKSKLQDLENKGEAGKIIDREKSEFRSKVNSLFATYSSEINNPGNVGSGTRADNILIKLEAALGEKINRLTLKSNTLNNRRVFLQQMREQIDGMLNIKLEDYDTKLAAINRGIDQKEIRRLIAYYNNLQEKMEKNVQIDEPTIQITKKNLERSFAIIGKYSIDLKKSYPKVQPLLDYPMPKIIQLNSVYDVWRDFFKGEYKGHGFIFWIIIAVLVDIAGYIVFYLSFRKED